MSESQLLHSDDVNGDIFINDDNEFFTEFTQVLEMEGGARLDTVRIPNDVLLKYFQSLVNTEIVMRGGSTKS